MKWHQMDRSALFVELEARTEGLTSAEVEERLRRYGPNSLPEEEGLSRLAVFLHQFKSPLIYILLVAAIVTAVLKE